MLRRLCCASDGIKEVYYELLKSSETITGDHYQLQIICLKQALKEKRPEWVNRHDSWYTTLDHVAKQIKQYLEGMKWEILPQPSYSPDITLSNFLLFHQSMQSTLSREWYNYYKGIKKWLDEWIASKESDFFHWGIYYLKDGRKFDGAYFELTLFCLNKYIFFIKKGRKLIPINYCYIQ